MARKSPVKGSSFFKDWLKDYESNYQRPPEKYSTGIAIFDYKLLGGFLPEQLVTIGGLPGSGKTTLAMQMAINFAERGQRVLIYNFEMSFESLICRILSNVLHISLTALFNREVDPVEITSQPDQLSFLANINFCDVNAVNLDYVNKDIDSILPDSSNSAPILIFDYIQRMPCLMKKNCLDVRQQIGLNLGAMKNIAVERKGLVINCCALNREAAQNGINITSFRDTGDFEYASDVLIGIATAILKKNTWKEALADDLQTAREETNLVTIIKMLKVKHNREAELKLVFYRDFQNFGPYVEDE